MKVERLNILVLLSAALLITGCGGDNAPPAQQGGADLTRGLLSAAGEERRGSGPVREVAVEDLGFNRGAPGAIVRVIELSDYGCGYCRQFHMETFPSLRAEFIESGMVEWKFVPYVTGMFENSMAAQRGAECALEQSAEVFERVNDRLWQAQSEWKSSGDAPALVRGWVAAAGADLDAYDGCQSSGRRMDRIQASGELARQLGLRGTPSFIVVGYGPLQGALPLETFQQILRSVHTDILSRGG